MNANASIRHRRVVRRRLWLITLCIFLPLIEIAVLQGVDFEQVMGLAPQVSAVPPFGLFHDLRWLYVYHASWGAFCGEWVGMIVARTVITMLLVRAAWPLRQAPPRWHVLLGQVLAFNTIAFLLLSPVVVLMFATSASGLAWPWYTAMVTVGEFSMLMPVWAIVGWSRLPNWQTIVLLVVVWLILAFVGGAIPLVPLWARYLIAAGLGAGNAYAWWLLTRILATIEHPWRFRPLPAIASLVIYGGLLVTLVITIAPSSRGIGPVHDVHPAVLGSTLLIVLGLDSEWTGMAPPLALPGFQEVMFSYRGLNAHDLPLPYPRAATHLPLREVADKIANQVRALVRRGANPIWVLADSEGSLGTQIYLASHPGAPVQRVVFTSPEVAPAQVYYPPRNQSGWGVVSGWVLRGWYKYLETMGWPKALEIVMRSVLEHGPLVARLERCPMSAAPHEVLLPLDTTVTMPFGLRSWIPIKVAGLTHGTMISATKFNSEVRRVLLREPLQQSRWWEAATWLGRAVGASFQLPPLNERLPEAWRADVGQGLDCRQTREAIRRNFAQAVPAHLGGEGTP